MTIATSPSYASDIEKDDYIVIGLATCFVREDGEIKELQVVEPVPSASVEVLFKGIATSYKLLHATTVGKLLGRDKPTLPNDFSSTVQLAEDFEERVFAAVRTYKRKESAKSLVPVGNTYSDLNYSTERKRILNASRMVKTEDNVKQHSHTHKVL